MSNDADEAPQLTAEPGLAPPVNESGTGSPSGFRLLVAGALGCAAAFVLTYVIFVLTTFGQRLDNAGMADLANMDWYFLSDVDVKVVMAAGAVVVVAVGLLRRRFGLTAVTLAGYVAALGVTWVLYRFLVRPVTDAVDPFATENSFPSGHLVTAMAIVLAVAMVLPRAARLAWLVPGAALVVGYGYGVVELGWHRYSDVIGGCLLAAAVLLAAAAFVTWRQQASGAGQSSGPLAVAAFATPLVFVGAAFALAGLMGTASSLLAAISGLLAVGLAYGLLSRPTWVLN